MLDANNQTEIKQRITVEGQNSIKDLIESFTTQASKYLVVDIETTGLDPEKSEIIEMYYKLVDTEGNILKEFEQLYFSEDSDLTKFIHNINKEDLIGKPKFEEFDHSEFIELLNKCSDDKEDIALMAQYSPFEMSFFAKYLNIEPYKKDMKIFDPKYVGTELYPEESHGLGKMAEFYGITTNDKLHRSKADVDLTFRVALAQIRDLNKLHFGQ